MIRIWIIVAIVAMLPTAASPALAWEPDVHYGLTRWLALQAGFTASEADDIARGNQDIDDDWLTGPIQSTAISCVLRQTPGARTVHDNHFPSQLGVPRVPSARIVKSGQVWRFSHLVPPPPVADAAAREELGAYLHALQDTWAHQGEPDTPAPPLCDPKYGWGHALDRGGWTCHLADITYPWSDVEDMATSTFTILAAAKKSTAKWTPQLATKLRAFVAADSKHSKHAWFTAEGVTNPIFLQATSLPDCTSRDVGCRPYPYSELVTQWRRLRRVGTGVPDVSQAMFGLFRRFIEAMVNAPIDTAQQQITALVDISLAAQSLQRTLKLSDSCPQLVPTYIRLMLANGFRDGIGARTPLALCELAVTTRGKGLMTCRQAVAAAEEAIALGVRVRQGPSLEDVRKELPEGVAPYEFFISRAEGIYLAAVRFIHRPNDMLLVTANDKMITGFTWMPLR